MADVLWRRRIKFRCAHALFWRAGNATADATGNPRQIHTPAVGCGKTRCARIAVTQIDCDRQAGEREARRGDRRSNAFFILCGVSAAFAVFASVLLFLKLVLGASL